VGAKVIILSEKRKAKSEEFVAASVFFVFLEVR